MITLLRPYPTRLIDRWTLPGGRRVVARPVLPQDAELEQSLVRGLSADARYQRFLGPVRELSPQLLEQMTRIDYERHVALVAETFDDGAPRVVAEARYVLDAGGRDAEFAVVVADDWRRLGLAARLICMLCGHARESGLASLYGEVLATNRPMLELLRRLGFARRRHPGDARLVLASIEPGAIACSRGAPAPRPVALTPLPAL